MSSKRVVVRPYWFLTFLVLISFPVWVTFHIRFQKKWFWGVDLGYYQEGRVHDGTPLHSLGKLFEDELLKARATPTSSQGDGSLELLWWGHETSNILGIGWTVCPWEPQGIWHVEGAKTSRVDHQWRCQPFQGGLVQLQHAEHWWAVSPTEAHHFAVLQRDLCREDLSAMHQGPWARTNPRTEHCSFRHLHHCLFQCRGSSLWWSWKMREGISHSDPSWQGEEQSP